MKVVCRQNQTKDTREAEDANGRIVSTVMRKVLGKATGIPGRTRGNSWLWR